MSNPFDFEEDSGDVCDCAECVPAPRSNEFKTPNTIDRIRGEVNKELESFDPVRRQKAEKAIEGAYTLLESMLGQMPTIPSTVGQRIPLREKRDAILESPDAKVPPEETNDSDGLLAEEDLDSFLNFCDDIDQMDDETLAHSLEEAEEQRALLIAATQERQKARRKGQVKPVGVTPTPFPSVKVSNKLAELEAEINERAVADLVNTTVPEKTEFEKYWEQSTMTFRADSDMPPKTPQTTPPKTRYDQPAPTKNGYAPLWPQVIEDIDQILYPENARLRDRLKLDMQERDTVGRARYGTPLQPHNGRDALSDAYSEALDMVVYLKQAVIENPTDGDILSLYRRAVGFATNLLRPLALSAGLKR